jgi:hypothetical protein
MDFNDFLRSVGIAPDTVNIMLHSPREREFAKVLPTLVHTRRSALDQYQSTHNLPAEQALKKGRPLVAVFVRIGDSRLVFAGLYNNNGWQEQRVDTILARPEAQFLLETYGIYREEAAGDPARTFAVFDLGLTDILSDLIGRLIIGADMTQTYLRLAERFQSKVLGIQEEGIAETPPPDWRDLTATTAFIRALPQGWVNKLSQWRGVYLIVDESDGARYVGSAYGDDTNILGRWMAHVAGEVGVTAQLKARKAINFRFSILERVSPDMPATDVIALERSWMKRLHTVQFGLNN